MKPMDVRKKHEKIILARLKQQSVVQTKQPRFKVNDTVRISKYKTLFQKGYTPNFSNEVFKIRLVKSTNPVTYALEDEKGNLIKGWFYEPEIAKSRVGNVYLVEKILKTRGSKV